MDGSSSRMRWRQISNPRFRVSRSACSHSVSVSMRGDSTAAAALRGEAGILEMPANAAATALVLRNSRRVYFMVGAGSSYASRARHTIFALLRDVHSLQLL